MPNENAQKGHALETAVKFIQETILESDPNLKGAKFSIETNKIVTVAGVRHELDVFVKTLPGSAYESACIFECKNWKAPVGKNEVIILAAKVTAVSANRAWLVARSITKDAEAQLKLDNRLGFISCTDDFLSPLDSMRLIHSIRDPFPMDVSIKQRGVPAKEHPDRLNWKDISCRLNGRPIDFLAYIREQQNKMIAVDTKERMAYYRHEGTHWSEQGLQIRFDVGEFMIDDWDVEMMTLVLTSMVTIRPRKILSKFELSGQGRIFTFEPLENMVDGKAVEINVVQRI